MYPFGQIPSHSGVDWIHRNNTSIEPTISIDPTHVLIPTGIFSTISFNANHLINPLTFTFNNHVFNASQFLSSIMNTNHNNTIIPHHYNTITTTSVHNIVTVSPTSPLYQLIQNSPARNRGFNIYSLGNHYFANPCFYINQNFLSISNHLFFSINKTRSMSPQDNVDVTPPTTHDKSIYFNTYTSTNSNSNVYMTLQNNTTTIQDNTNDNTQNNTNIPNQNNTNNTTQNNTNDNTQNNTSITHSYYTFISFNCRSIKNKILGVLNFLEDSRAEMVFLQETWLAECDNSLFQQFSEFGYKHVSHTRENRRGGGISILYKDVFTPDKIVSKKELTYSTFECICCFLTLNKTSLTVINLYRPPYSHKHKYTIRDFLTEFEVFLDTITRYKGVILMCGDFNINLLNKNNLYSTEFSTLLTSFNLEQTVTQPTHINGGLIDLTIIDKKLSPDIHVETSTDFQSDHFPIKITYKTPVKTSPRYETKLVRSYDKCNPDLITEDVKNSNLIKPEIFSKMTVEECLQFYNSTLAQIFDIHCPLVSKRYRTDCERPPWYNSTLQQAKQFKRRAERKYKKDPSEENKSNLHKSRNEYNKKLKTRRTEYFKNKISVSLNDQKTLFKTLNKISGTTKKKVLPTYDTNQNIADQFSEHYINKISNIRTNINNKCISQPSENISFAERPILFQKFQTITLYDLNKIIKSMKKKFSNLDPIPTSLLTNSLETLSPIILHIINEIITNATFPSALKYALITPIIKNTKVSNQDLGNYRPVSSLPFFSKIVERAIYDQLEGYLERNNLHAYSQSAYRKFNSCETAMIKITDDIQKHLLDNKYVAMILLDNSCAFDTVDHEILCNMLESNFHLGKEAIKLIRSYLGNRSFSVIVGGARSKAQPLKHGVPQGSLLGPLLYIMYTKEIEAIANKFRIQINMYADDVQLYISFELNDLHQVKSDILNCLSEIKTYMDLKFLKINTDKTQLKLFKPNKISLNYNLNFSGTTLECLQEINILGVKINNNLDLSKFIAKKVQVCSYKLRNLTFIKNSLPYQSRVTLITNLILSNLDYCNALLACASESALRPLQLILNRAVRFIFNIGRRTHITPFLKKLHFLPVNQRIFFKTCLTAFKVFNGIAPAPLQSKFKKFVPTTAISLRNNVGRDKFMFEESLEDHKRNTVANKIKINWNSLPLRTRQLPRNEINKFKTELKTLLFKKAFEL